jgi:hypothetical protein
MLFGLAPVFMTLPGYDSSIGGSEMSSKGYSSEFKDKALSLSAKH